MAIIIAAIIIITILTVKKTNKEEKPNTEVEETLPTKEDNDEIFIDNDEHSNEVVDRVNVPSVSNILNDKSTLSILKIEHVKGQKSFKKDVNYDKIYLSDGTVLDVTGQLITGGYDIYQSGRGIEIIGKEFDFDITIVPVYYGDANKIGQDYYNKVGYTEDIRTFAYENYNSTLEYQLENIREQYKYEYSLYEDKYSFEDGDIYSYATYQKFIEDNKLEAEVSLYSENQMKEIFLTTFDINKDILQRYSMGTGGQTITNYSRKYCEGSNYLTYSEPITENYSRISYLYFMYDHNACYAVMTNIKDSSETPLYSRPFIFVSISSPDSANWGEGNYNDDDTYESLGFSDDYEVISTDTVELKQK